MKMFADLVPWESQALQPLGWEPFQTALGLHLLCASWATKVFSHAISPLVHSFPSSPWIPVTRLFEATSNGEDCSFFYKLCRRGQAQLSSAAGLQLPWGWLLFHGWAVGMASVFFDSTSLCAVFLCMGMSYSGDFTGWYCRGDFSLRIDTSRKYIFHLVYQGTWVLACSKSNAGATVFFGIVSFSWTSCSLQSGQLVCNEWISSLANMQYFNSCIFRVGLFIKAVWGIQASSPN